jgi:hypothetical protein
MVVLLAHRMRAASDIVKYLKISSEWGRMQKAMVE